MTTAELNTLRIMQGGETKLTGNMDSAIDDYTAWARRASNDSLTFWHEFYTWEAAEATPMRLFATYHNRAIITGELYRRGLR